MPAVPYSMEGLREITSLPAPVLNPHSASELRAIQARVEAVVKYAMPATVGVIVEDGQGSGVIVSADGYVLTAGHVSGDPNKEVTIVFANGKTVTGKALGANNGIDSGMVKITTPPPAGGYPHVPLGTAKAERLPTNQWVVAMGHPGGYRPGRPPVVRLGRVLKVQRNRAEEPQYIQTDCPLINGDSGGPLFDLDGRLVGINSRIGVDTRTNLHVPIDTFTQTWDRLADAQKWNDRPGFFGRRGDRPDRSAPKQEARLGVRNVDDPRGALVEFVFAGTPAEGRLAINDIVTRINGQVIRSAQDLEQMMGKYKPGDTIKVDLLRNNQPRQVDITLAAKE
jgi:serine protease Do